MAGDCMHTGNNAAASEHFCELAKLAGDLLKERLAQDPEYTNQESELAPVSTGKYEDILDPIKKHFKSQVGGQRAIAGHVEG